MSKDKETAATDAATEQQDIRQFVVTEPTRQAPTPEPAAPDSS
jgi:hypothetical protein